MNNQDEFVLKRILDECDSSFKNDDCLSSIYFHKLTHAWNDKIIDIIRKMDVYNVIKEYGFIIIAIKRK